jgi:hypothetical protein
MSSMPAASADLKPSTSRSTSTARCRGGRRWIAVMNASAIVSRASYRASGPATTSGRSASGYGSSQTSSVRRVGSGGVNGGSGAVRCRLPLARSAFRQRLVAIRYSQVRIEARPS